MAAVVPLGLAISTSWWASLVTFIIAGAAAEGAIVTGSSPAWQKHFQRDGHIMDHQVMLVFNSTGGIADTPKVSIEASVDVADLSANFTLGDGRVLQGQLEGFPLISESGEMCGGFHVDVPGSAHPLSGSWYAVDPTTDKNKSKALSNLIDVLAKDGNAKLTERYFAELVEKHPEILDW